jgi:hypothetical protein
MNPFCLVWSNAPAGRYTLNALATDNGGATSRSEAVFIVVGASDSTNYPPIVRIMSPANGAVFPLGANVPIYAFAQDRDDRVASVEFFADRVSIGFGSNLLSNTTTPRDSTNVWTLVWRDAALGRHVLTARANDTRGAAGGSEPVGIAVVLPPEPPTNRPALITIAAVDPIAIEGTNCWPWRGLTNPVPTWTNWGDPRLDCRYYTNCGPKNATFLVRRLGATNDPVTVTYAIGGTATNGVDYVELPGSVTIPAGQRGARITVVPLDDGVPDRNRTVVLRLQPSAAVPADYVLGRPSSAAALIVDSLRPRPGTGLLADRTFHLNETGPDGAWFRVEFSTDMVNWNTVCINQVINGSIDFIDPDAAADQSRFYRAVPELDAPME